FHEYAVIEEIKQLLKDAVYGVDEIGKIVLNLKNFSRLDRSDWATCTVEECLENTLQLAKTVVKGKKLRKIFAQTPPLRCSPSQLNQVFLNLITNAAQATIDRDGMINVVTKILDPDHVTVEVIENGLGSTEEVLSTIFDTLFSNKDDAKRPCLGI